MQGDAGIDGCADLIPRSDRRNRQFRTHVPTELHIRRSNCLQRARSKHHL